MTATDSLFSLDTDTDPSFSLEEKLYREGSSAIAGVDEAGRGPLAGPVVAAAVILDPNKIPDGLNDSKQLNGNQREALFGEILVTSAVCWTSLPANVIDRINIREATLLAMTHSVQRSAVTVDTALIDGRDVPVGLTKIGTALVKGDARSVSISAASIVAKVIRDRMMVRAAADYPEYGFEKHKGYGSKMHRDAIHEFGPSPLHRRTFAPMKNM